jgi:hypothetical protein
MPNVEGIRNEAIVVEELDYVRPKLAFRPHLAQYSSTCNYQKVKEFRQMAVVVLATILKTT